jgi:phosphatidylglycerophosphate synthase
MNLPATMLGRIADLLTLVRLAVAPALMATLGVGRLTPAAALLALAWLTDALDGPAARAAQVETRLGHFDLLADTAVGAGALAGLGLAGDIPAVLAGTLLAVVGTGFLVLRNAAMSMALQAVGYAGLIWTLWDEGEDAVWLPLATAAGLLLLLHRRLFQAVIPGFLRGLATLRRRQKRFDL